MIMTHLPINWKLIDLFLVELHRLQRFYWHFLIIVADSDWTLVQNLHCEKITIKLRLLWPNQSKCSTFFLVEILWDASSNTKGFNKHQMRKDSFEAILGNHKPINYFGISMKFVINHTWSKDSFSAWSTKETNFNRSPSHRSQFELSSGCGKRSYNYLQLVIHEWWTW